MLEIILYLAVLILAIYFGLRSLHSLLALRKEKLMIENFYDNEVIREVRSRILKEQKTGNPLINLLSELYDDLYNLISEEEANRKKEIESIKAEVAKLKEEIIRLKQAK